VPFGSFFPNALRTTSFPARTWSAPRVNPTRPMCSVSTSMSLASRFAPRRASSTLRSGFTPTTCSPDATLVGRAIDARLAVDPYATLDVVLAPRGPFPLNLLDMVFDRLRRATPLSRVLAHRGEDLQSRLVVVLRERTWFAPDYLSALRTEVPICRDQPWRQALADAERLGDDLPAARVIDPSA